MSPISLSDDQLAVVTRFAEPLAPPDRSAFLAALANMLRSEPQPVGDGAVHRAVKELLASGVYKRSDTMAVGGNARPSWHNGASKLRDGAPVGRARSK